MKKNIKLVICDIDSTLVTSDHILTKKTKAVIDALHEQGVYFGIASGRPIDEIAGKAKQWGFDYEFDILIGMNGSELRDNIHHQDYEYYLLKKEWIKEIIAFMEPFDANYFIYQDGYLLSRRMDDMMKKSAKSSNKEVIVAKGPDAFYERANAKIMFRVKEEVMPEIEAYIAKHPNPYYKGFKTQTTLMEFADGRISKAYALERFCELNDLSLQEVAAFGDTTNDNEMIKVSGLGVCMINGSDDTKALANEITEKSNDEDGLAHYIENHLF